MFALFSTGGFFAPAFAQRCENLPLNLDLIAYLGDTIEDYESSWIGNTCEDSIEDVVVRNNIAYLTVRGSGLQMVDVSNPTMPVLLGTLPTSLKAVGITNPCNPDLNCAPATATLPAIVTCARPLPTGVDVDNRGYAYVADGATATPIDCTPPLTDPPALLPVQAGGLFIANVSNPSSPTVASQTPASAFIDSTTGLPAVGLSAGNAQDIVVGKRGNKYYAYVAGGSAGLQMYNVTNPNAPSWVGSLTYAAAPTPAYNNAFSVCLSPNGKIAYVGYLPTVTGLPAPPLLPAGVACSSLSINPIPALDPLYFPPSPQTLRLRIVDVDPTSPTFMTDLSPGGLGVEVWGRVEAGVDTLQGGKYVCVAAYIGGAIANTPHGLSIVDVSNPATATVVGFYVSRCFCPKVFQRLASVADVAAGAVPACPLPVPPIFPLANANRYRSYLLNEIIVPLGGVPIDGTVAGAAVEHRARRVHVVGNRAYVAATMSGVQVFDVSNPTNPQIIGSYGPGVARDVFVEGDTAYVAAGSGLQIYEINNCGGH